MPIVASATKNSGSNAIMKWPIAMIEPPSSTELRRPSQRSQMTPPTIGVKYTNAVYTP